jgi:hypothetical protein
MDDNTLKVVARFTEVGQWWLVGAWIYIARRLESSGNGWHKIRNSETETLRIRLAHELSEAEANQKGLFRGVEDV